MKNFALALKPLVAALVLGACSTSPTMPEKAWKISPVQTVRHGGGNAAAGYFALGRYHEGRGAVAQAFSAYHKALDADPDHVGAWNAIGLLHAQAGRFEEALPALERAVGLAPGASHLHNNLGFALMLAGRDEAAAVSLQRAVELDGTNRRAWSNLATTYRQLGMPDKAELAEARASGAWPATPVAATASGRSAGTATRAAPSAPNADTAAAPGAVSITPVVAAPPVEVLPPNATPETKDAATRTGDSASARSPRIAAPVTGPVVGSAPKTLLVKTADNVYELRNGPPSAAEAVAEAAAIIAAVAPPAADAANATSAARPEPMTPATAPLPAHISKASRPARVEITNGQGGEGLARRLAAMLGERGVARPRLTNRLPYTQQATFVEYRDGYREAAEAFAAHLPFRPTIASAASKDLIVDVRLMLGHDLSTGDACAVLALCGTVARAPAPKLEVAQRPHRPAD